MDFACNNKGAKLLFCTKCQLFVGLILTFCANFEIILKVYVIWGNVQRMKRQKSL